MKVAMEQPLVTISGPSGVGKTSVVLALLTMEKGYARIVTHTTRKPRQNEKEGIDYYFISDSVFGSHDRSGSFLDARQIYDSSYGISEQEILRLVKQGFIAVANVDPLGALSLCRQIPNSISFFILPPSIEKLESRLRKRSAEPEPVIVSRLRSAKREIRMKDQFDFKVVNSEIQRTAEEIHDLIVQSQDHANSA